MVARAKGMEKGGNRVAVQLYVLIMQEKDPEICYTLLLTIIYHAIKNY